MAKALSNASKAASKSVAKLTGKSPSTTARSTAASPAATSSAIAAPPRSSGNNAVTINPDRRVNVAVPGLFALSDAAIPQMMPQFDPNAYQISDPLNPPESLPQLSIADSERIQGIYEGGIRALQTIGLSLDLSRERFGAIGKQAKAVAAGFNALGEQEKAKGSVLDYQTQQEVTQQKGLKYQVASHQTQTESEAVPYAIVQLDEALKQQEIKAEMAKSKREEASSNLDAFQQSLGKFLPAKAQPA